MSHSRRSVQNDTIVHPLEPVFDRNSRVLILGTMPSPRSREAGFYYGHPQNKFWRVLSDVFGEQIPPDKNAKISFLLKHHIALWDVLRSCTISGADDNSIKDPVPNDLSIILSEANIRAVFTTGKKATWLYEKYCLPQTGIPAHYLPSTSPANGGISYEEIIILYAEIRKERSKK
jgi:hypoxanthine-DNA glycosylase